MVHSADSLMPITHYLCYCRSAKKAPASLQFSAHKGCQGLLQVPKKLDADGGGSIATLPPDSYLLLDDDRRIADVLHDYEVRGAQNKLLLKRRRFDGNDADFSKPQFIALTEVRSFCHVNYSLEEGLILGKLEIGRGESCWTA